MGCSLQHKTPTGSRGNVALFRVQPFSSYHICGDCEWVAAVRKSGRWNTLSSWGYAMKSYWVKLTETREAYVTLRRRAKPRPERKLRISTPNP
jgi:hypothetical protein